MLISVCNELLLGELLFLFLLFFVLGVPLDYKAIGIVGFDAKHSAVINFCSNNVYRSFSFLTSFENTFSFTNHMMDFSEPKHLGCLLDLLILPLCILNVA